jgi:hypothetical protein
MYLPKNFFNLSPSKKVEVKMEHCSSVPFNRVFKRSGIIPYIKIGSETFFVLSIFSGYEFDKFIDAELSDFGGRSELGETFIKCATNEAFEESLGIFDFVGRERKINSTSHVVYKEDNSIILIFTPFTLQQDCNVLNLQFGKRRNVISKRSVTKTQLRVNTKIFTRPTIDTRNELPIFIFNENMRDKAFNPDESIGIIHISGSDLLELMKDNQVPIPVSNRLSDKYKNYPLLYSIVKNCLLETNIIEYIISL